MPDTPASLPDDGAAATIRPSLGGLFAGFFSVGICGFGGVLPWARRMMVERRRWLTGPEFTDLMGFCQFLPGPNVINVSVAYGARVHGPLGSLVAFAGLMTAPIGIVVLLAIAYDRFSGIPWVRAGFVGLAAAASGLVLSMAWKMASPLWRRPVAVGLAAITCLAVVGPRLPLPLVIAVMAPLGILAARKGWL